uniref:Transcription factor grauzone n=1 Tax=Anopheles coluzzii TaxID=1518534 RepID=A0A6E8VGP2_ANOCL|nr:transcription factor grauzone-like [Anopheles coluzzii]
MGEICRLCLDSLPKCTGISIKNEQFKEELKAAFRFEIDYKSNLPELVCDRCRDTVSHIHTYIQDVWSNQQSLLLEANTTVVQPEEYLVEKDVSDTKLFEKEELPKIQEPGVVQDLQIEFVQPDPDPIGLNDDDANEKRNIASSEDDDDTLQVKEKEPAETAETADQPSSKKAKTSVSDKPKKTRANRKENDKIIDEFYTMECEICSAPANNFGTLINHYRAEHDIKGYVRCCDKQYFNRSYLVDHIASHKGLTRCEICDRTYKTMRYLNQHMSESHSQRDAKPFKCTQCHMAYSKEHLLRAHMQMHVKKQCQFCQKMLSNHYSLKLHISQVHSGDNHQICATCGKLFRTSFAMERHIRLHHQPQLVNWEQCEQCEKWFDCKENLKKHVRLRHDERGQFPCDKCEHVSVNRRSLVFHKNRIHKERQLYDCKHCGKQLLSKLGLREHLATHSNVPLYSCEFCDVTFNSSANKYKHYKSKHNKEWQDQKHQKLLDKMSAAPVDVEQL